MLFISLKMKIQEYELTKYRELLKGRGLEWGQRSMENADVSNMDAARYQGITYGHGASREILRWRYYGNDKIWSCQEMAYASART